MLVLFKTALAFELAYCMVKLILFEDWKQYRFSLPLCDFVQNLLKLIVDHY